MTYRIAILCGLLLGHGCARGPTPIPIPKVDGSQVAESALEQLDSNQDGLLQREELAAAPGLLAAVPRMDKDGDGQISTEEIVARVTAWRDSRAGLIPVRCTLMRKGKPVAGARIELEPEACLQETIQPARGTTNRFGMATLSIPESLRPTDEKRAGIQFGFYRVRITAAEGQPALPPRYNSSTTLGTEISMDAPGVQAGNVIFELK